VTAQLIAVDNFSGFNRHDGCAFWSGDVDAVVEARAPRSKSRVDRAIYRPEKCLEPRLRGNRCCWCRLRGRDRLHRYGTCRPWYKKPLANLDLSGVFDSVNAGQLLVGHTIGFADPK